MKTSKETRCVYAADLVDSVTGEVFPCSVAIITEMLAKDVERLWVAGINSPCHQSFLLETVIKNDSCDTTEISQVNNHWLLGYVHELDITIICQGTFFNIPFDLYSIELVGFSYGQISEREITPEICTRQTIHY